MIRRIFFLVSSILPCQENLHTRIVCSISSNTQKRNGSITNSRIPIMYINISLYSFKLVNYNIYLYAGPRSNKTVTNSIVKL